MRPRSLREPPLALAIAAACALTLAACSNDTTGTGPGTASGIIANSGVDAQTGTVGQALTQAISVHVTDVNGNGVPGAVVTWSVFAGGGTTDSTSSTTDASGNATTFWTLGTTAGADSLRASLADGATVVLSATANAGPLASLVTVSGGNQSVSAGTETQPLVVKAVDQYGNPVSGVVVTWAVTTGNSTVDASSTTTGTDGLAQADVMTSATPGLTVVTASAAGATPLAIDVTGT